MHVYACLQPLTANFKSAHLSTSGRFNVHMHFSQLRATVKPCEGYCQGAALVQKRPGTKTTQVEAYMIMYTVCLVYFTDYERPTLRLLTDGMYCG